MTKVFISYSRNDLDFVEELASDLKDVGISVWYDLSRLEGGDQWAEEIQTAIDSCDKFVLVISSDSIRSEWVLKEFLYAKSTGKRIVPLLYKNCKLPLWLQDIHFIDVQGDKYHKNFREIVRALDVKTIPEIKKKNESLKAQRIIIALIGIAAIIVLGIISRFLEIKQASATPEPTKTFYPKASLTPTAITTPTTIPLPTEIVDKFGAEMVLVPEGNFIMGNNNGNSDEQPAHNVFLDTFYIDKYEVTNAQFVEFLIASGETSNDVDYVSVTDERHNIWIVELYQLRIHSTENTWYVERGFENYPASSIGWYGAQAYCTWRGARLPTEAEWEKAARGPDGLNYPWGEQLHCEFANVSDCNRLEFLAVGSYPKGISPYGAYDMIGNVEEWVSDWYSENYYSESPVSNPQGPLGEDKVVRGGAAGIDHENGSCPNITTCRDAKRPADIISFASGFRCAKDAP